MQEPTPLNNLTKLGLNTYEARAYLALRERRSLTATQISAVSGIPRTKVYDVTEALMKKGLCSLVSGRINKYSAFEIDVVAENLLQESQRDFNKRKEMIQQAAGNLKHQFSMIRNPLGDDVDPLEYIEVIRDRYQIHRKFCQLTDEAEREILVFTKPPYSVPRERLYEQHEKGRESLKKGVINRTVYEIPEREEEREWLLSQVVKKYREVGEEARIIKELPIKMAVFDERIVVYALEDPLVHTLSFTMQVIEHTSLAKSLKILFQTVWNQAEDYGVLET